MATEETAPEEKPPVSKIIEEAEEPAPSELPARPGTIKQEPVEKPQLEQIPKEEKPKEKGKAKISPLIIAIGALGFLLVIILLKPAPSGNQQPEVVVAPDARLLEEIQNIKIRHSQLQNQVSTIQKQRDEASQLVEALRVQNETLQSRLNTAEQASKDNRNYISTIYRQLLDLQLKMEAIGGGYGDVPQRQPEGRVVNPYIGEGNLP